MGYDRKSIHPVEKVFPLVAKNRSFNLDGDWINPSSRYKLFYRKGTKCVICGLNGTYFAKERNGSSIKYHLNLYGKNSHGQEIMLTKDHILPRSKGGADTLANYQTMCAVCNQRKGNNMSDDDHKIIAKTNAPSKSSRPFRIEVGTFSVTKTPLSAKTWQYLLPKKIKSNKEIYGFRWLCFNFVWDYT